MSELTSLPGLLGSSAETPSLLTQALCRDKDGHFSLNDILDMLELGRARARLHQVQTASAWCMRSSSHTCVLGQNIQNGNER